MKKILLILTITAFTTSFAQSKKVIGHTQNNKKEFIKLESDQSSYLFTLSNTKFNKSETVKFSIKKSEMSLSDFYKEIVDFLNNGKNSKDLVKDFNNIIIGISKPKNDNKTIKFSIGSLQDEELNAESISMDKIKLSKLFENLEL